MAEAVVVEVAVIMLFATSFRTVFGFGEALIAVPLLALLIPVKVAAPLAVLASIVIAAFIVARDWRHIHFRSAGWLVSSTLVGLPVGLWLLSAVSESAMKLALATIIFLFSGYSLLSHAVFSRSQTPRMQTFALRNDRFAWVFGWLAGVCGGSYGMNGPPLAIYGSLRGWEPERFRATLQGYFLPASLLGLFGYGVTGLLTATVTHLFLWSIPSIVIGIFLGRRINRKLSPNRFVRLLHFGLLLIAVVLAVQTLRV